MKPMRSDWLIPAALVLLGLVPGAAGAARLAEIGGGGPVTADNARFFAAPVPVLLHIPTAIVFALLGAFQFSPGIRRRHRAWHRAAGRILIPAGLVVALSGLWMTVSYPWAPGDGTLVYVERLVFGCGMTFAIVLGINAIRRRDFTAHGDWMMRAYAIGMGAGTQVLTHLPWFLLADGRPGEDARAVMMGAGWAINTMVAEWVIRRRVGHAHPRLATTG